MKRLKSQSIQNESLKWKIIWEAHAISLVYNSKVRNGLCRMQEADTSSWIFMTIHGKAKTTNKFSLSTLEQSQKWSSHLSTMYVSRSEQMELQSYGTSSTKRKSITWSLLVKELLLIGCLIVLLITGESLLLDLIMELSEYCRLTETISKFWILLKLMMLLCQKWSFRMTQWCWFLVLLMEHYFSLNSSQIICNLMILYAWLNLSLKSTISVGMA